MRILKARMNQRQPDPVDQVKVLLFASLREQAGWSDRCISLSRQRVFSAREIWDGLDLGEEINFFWSKFGIVFGGF